MTKTFNGKRMSEAVWNREFSKSLRSIVGDGYQACPADFVDGRYLFNVGIDPRRAAEQVSKRRVNQARDAEVIRVRVWRDRYNASGVYDPKHEGEIEVRGDIDAGTADVIRDLFAIGQTEGRFMVWVSDPDRRFDGEVLPKLVKWESL